MIQAIPASRGYGNLLATVPGIQATELDVSSGVSTNFFTARGGRGNEGTIQIDGMNVGSAFNGGGVAGFGYPIGESSEIQVTISGGLGESIAAGRSSISFRRPVETTSAARFLSTAGKWSQGDNLDRRVAGLRSDERPRADQELGYELRHRRSDHRDRLWFFNNIRSYGNQQEIPGLFGNRNAGNQASWTTRKTKPAGARPRPRDDRSHPPDRAGHAASQGRLLPGLPEGL